jgi:Cu/Ag efflux protein CusF
MAQTLPISHCKEEIAMNRKQIAGAIALGVMACSGTSIPVLSAQAQTTKPGTMPEKPRGTMKGAEVEGRVRDVKGNQITLDSGMKLTVPKTEAKANELKTGSKIKATYEEKGGQKVVTSLEITEGPQSGGTK